MITAEDADELVGVVALDRSNDRIGEVRRVIPARGDAAWVSVRLGSPEIEVLVPLEGAEWEERSLRTTVLATAVQSAPAVPAVDVPSEQEQQRLLRHYGIPCVCTPRSVVDLIEVADGEVSYSVKDDVMRDDADGQPDDEADLGRAMREASEQRSEGVTGRMLEAAPEAEQGA